MRAAVSEVQLTSLWWRAGRLLAVTLVTCWVGTQAAQAYVIGGQRWPGHTIPYYDAQPDHAAVRAAVAAWNSSGAHIRFVAVPRGRAKLLILPWHPGGCYGVEGFATVGYFAGGDVVHLKACPNRDEAAMVAAHELGHILGLQHEMHRCATMNPSLDSRCRTPPPYMTDCRILQLDDEQGAVSRYGGHARAIRSPQFCPEYSPPTAPTSATIDGNAPPAQELLATVHDAAERRLVVVPAPPGFTAPQGFSFKQTAPQLTAKVYAYQGSCPKGPPQGPPLAVQPLPQSGSGQVDLGPRAGVSAGVWCYAVWTTDAAGRRSASATTVTVTVSHQGPSASFEADTDPYGSDVSFTDTSTQGDEPITSWSWSFGDGSSSTDPDPYYTYSQAGTYTVTLTVTSADGLSSTVSQQVAVPSPAG